MFNRRQERKKERESNEGEERCGTSGGVWQINNMVTVEDMCGVIASPSAWRWLSVA